MADLYALCGQNSPHTTVPPTSSYTYPKLPPRNPLRIGMQDRDAEGNRLCSVPIGPKKRSQPLTKVVRSAREGKPRAIPVMNNKKRAPESVSAVREAMGGDGCVCGKMCATLVTHDDIGGLRSRIWDKNRKQQNAYIMAEMSAQGHYKEALPSSDCSGRPTTCLSDTTGTSGLPWTHGNFIAGKRVRQGSSSHSKRARMLVGLSAVLASKKPYLASKV
jgi:hypothetical protein